MNFVSEILVLLFVGINCDSRVDDLLTSYDACRIEVQPGKTCYNTQILDDIPYLEERTSPFPNNSIFFIETTCTGGLSLRQACSVEAAARAHPDRQVIVLFAGPVTTRCLTSSPSWEILKYMNVNLYRVNIPHYFKKTPLEILVTSQRRCPVSWLSDILRFLTLYKFGGVYLDLDMIISKSLDGLPDKQNFAGRIDSEIMGAGLVSLSRDGIGRLIATAVLRAFVDKFRTKTGWQKSADVLTHVLRVICNTSDVRHMSATNCEGFTIYDSFYFYPIHYKTWKNYFTYYNSIIPTEPYAFHLWNGLSRNETIYEDSLYASLINKHCPRVKNITY